jgi:hypothetical protein
MADELVRLVYDPGASSAQLEEVRKKLEELAEKTRQAASTYDLLDQKTEAYVITLKELELGLQGQAAATQHATWAQKELDKAVEETNESAKKLAPQLDGPTKGSSGLGRSAMAASYAFQDFTSQLGTQGVAGGLRAIQNNIPGMLMGFEKLSAGWVAAISAMAVGAGILYENWDKIAKGMSSDAIDKAKNDLEKLAKKADEFNAMLGKPTRAEAAGGKIIEEALGGGEQTGRIARVLAAQLGRSGRGEQMTTEESKQIAAAESQVEMVKGTRFEAEERNVLARLQGAAKERIRKANAAAVQGALVDVQKGGEGARVARALLSPLVAAGPAGLPAGFLGALETSAPEEIEKQQQLEAQGELNIESIKRREQDQKAKQKETQKKEDEHRKEIRDRQKLRMDKLNSDARAADQEDRGKDDAAREAARNKQEALRDEDKARREKMQIGRANQHEAIQNINKMQQQANQATDDFMQMMHENGNIFNGVMYSVDQLRNMAYWAKRQTAKQAEQMRESAMGGGNN